MLTHVTRNASLSNLYICMSLGIKQMRIHISATDLAESVTMMEKCGSEEKIPPNPNPALVLLLIFVCLDCRREKRKRKTSVKSLTAQVLEEKRTTIKR